MDGKIVIGTEIDTSGFDSDYKKLEKELQDKQNELNMLMQRKDLAEIQGDTDTTFDIDKKIERVNAEIDDIQGKINGINNDTQQIADNAEVFENNLGNVQLTSEEIKQIIEETGKTLKKSVKSIKNTILAVFGLRSAYMFVRNAISTISGDDKQLKADIDYIKKALAYTIEPIVRGIVNFVKQMLIYIGYIIKAWTGKNIFENANKSLQNTNKQAKQLSKTLAGFDEMNVVGGGSDTSNTDATITPSFDLSNIEEKDMPELVKIIAKYGKEIGAVLAGIGSAILAKKIVDFIKNLKKVKDGLAGIKALGIGTIVTGIVLLIGDIIDMINNPSWETFIKILTDIAIIIGGIMLLTGNWWGLLVVFIAGIVRLIVDNWDKIKNVLTKVGSWIFDNVIKPVDDFFKGLWNGIKEGFSATIDFVKGLFDKLVNKIEQIIDRAKLIIEAFIKGVKFLFKGMANVLIGILNTLIDAVNIIVAPLRAIIVGFGWVIGKNWSFDDIKIPNIPYLAKGGIVNNPGSGVMMGNYVAGEKGPEAVIPLDDNTLDRLGYAFAKHTVINATIVNEMNGRIISRELQKINAEDNFAYNG